MHYKIKLSWYIASFFVQLGASYVKPLKLSLFSVASLTIIVMSGELAVLSHSYQTVEKGLEEPHFSDETFIPIEVTRSEAQLELQKWLWIAEQQPTHRDVLLNIVQLYSAVGEENQSIFFLQQAQKIDPNNPLFISSKSLQ